MNQDQQDTEVIFEDAESEAFFADLGVVCRLPEAECKRLYEAVDPTGERGAGPGEVVEVWRERGRPGEQDARARLAAAGLDSDTAIAEHMYRAMNQVWPAVVIRSGGAA